MEHIIKSLINNNIASYRLDKFRKETVKIRYEYKYRNKINNLFLYFSKWSEFMNIYEKIPIEERHFYEIINNECKFFLDLDSKIDNMKKEEWNIYVNNIKKCLKSVIYEITGNKINIIEFESLIFPTEDKYSSHLIINEFRFNIEQCKRICNIIIDKLDTKTSKIIDNKIYNNWRSLRLQESTKIDSRRIKKLKIDNQYIDTFNLDGLVTRIDDTISFNISLDNFYKSNKKTNIFDNFKFYNFNKHSDYIVNEEDVAFIKKNYNKLELFVNKFHNCQDVFVTHKIINNMIMYIKKAPYNCNVCNRTHENQNPYIYINHSEIYFNCRRSNRSIKVTNYFKN